MVIFRIIPISINDLFQNYSYFHWWLFSELFLFPLMIIFRIIPVKNNKFKLKFSIFWVRL